MEPIDNIHECDSEPTSPSKRGRATSDLLRAPYFAELGIFVNRLMYVAPIQVAGTVQRTVAHIQFGQPGVHKTTS